MVDTFRHQHGEKPGCFTYWSARNVTLVLGKGDSAQPSSTNTKTSVSVHLSIPTLAPQRARDENKGLRLDYFIASSSICASSSAGKLS